MKLKWLSIFLVIFLLAIVFLANTGLLPNSIRRIYKFPYGDKVGHFLLMGLVSFVLNWTALASHANPKIAPAIWKVSLVFAIAVTLEEFSQQLFPRRTFSLLDLVFSYVGISFAAFLVWWLKRK